MPPVLRLGPYNTTEPDVDELHFCPAMLMPVEEVAAALTTNINGIYSYLAFYNTFLAPALGSGNAEDLIPKYKYHSKEKVRNNHFDTGWQCPMDI